MSKRKIEWVNAMLEFSIPPNTFSAAEDEVIASQFSGAEDRILINTQADQQEIAITAEAGQRYVKIPDEVVSIEALAIDGEDVTDKRVPIQRLVTIS